jgi:3-oxoacyl-[acyl-carrier protein] reductase
MDLGLADRTALVTGASRGLGRSIALGLAAEGARIAIAARRRNLLDEVSQEIVRAGGHTPFVLEADLEPEGSAEQLAVRASAELGAVDILVNSAGGSRPTTFDAGTDVWLEGMTVNFLRLRELTHALVPSMQARGFGRVINLTGTSEPRILNAAFAAKAAVHAWSKGLSTLVAPDGVTVNCIQPGKLRSEQIDLRWPTEESRREFAEHAIPAKRFGEPEELAAVAVFLASSRASYVTGTVIPVDGGSRHFAF